MSPTDDEGHVVPDPARPPWLRDEIAWPLAILAGFAGAWLGVLAGWPDAGSALAALFFLPLFLGFLRRGELHMAAVLGIGWLAGLCGCLYGAVLDGDLVPDRAQLLARGFPHVEWWLEARLTGGGETDPGPGAVVESLAVLFLAGALSRLTRGLGLLILAWLASLVCLHAAELALEGIRRTGGSALSAALVSFPPFAAAGLAGGLCLCAEEAWRADRAAADPPEGAPRAATVLGAGLALAALGLVGALALGETWGRWAGGALGLR